MIANHFFTNLRYRKCKTRLENTKNTEYNKILFEGNRLQIHLKTKITNKCIKISLTQNKSPKTPVQKITQKRFAYVRINFDTFVLTFGVPLNER